MLDVVIGTINKSILGVARSCSPLRLRLSLALGNPLGALGRVHCFHWKASPYYCPSSQRLRLLVSLLVDHLSCDLRTVRSQYLE